MTKAITENRKTWCNKQILASNNTIKTMWNIIKTETNRKGNIENIFVSAVVMMKVMIIEIFLIPSTIFSFQWLIK